MMRSIEPNLYEPWLRPVPFSVSLDHADDNDDSDNDDSDNDDSDSDSDNDSCDDKVMIDNDSDDNDDNDNKDNDDNDNNNDDDDDSYLIASSASLSDSMTVSSLSCSFSINGIGTSSFIR